MWNGGEETWTGFICPGYVPVTGFLENGNELAVCVKCEVVLIAPELLASVKVRS
jgi:hypothetical protein